MAQFAILRVGKLKNWRAVRSAGGHNLRTRPVPNADPNGPPVRVLHGLENLADAVADRLTEAKKYRKDAVLASELILTGSPEAMAAKSPAELDAWTSENVRWLLDRFGPNLVQVVIHLDETTPHLHAVVVPINSDNGLSAKRFWGEAAGLSALQTDYAQAMKPHGLERGVMGSKAKHRTLRAFYGSLMGIPDAPALPPMPRRPRPEDEAITGLLRARSVVAAFREWRLEIVEWVKEIRSLLKSSLAENADLRGRISKLEAERLTPRQEAGLKRRSRRHLESDDALRLLEDHPEGVAALLEQASEAREARRAALRGALPPTPPSSRAGEGRPLTRPKINPPAGGVGGKAPYVDGPRRGPALGP